MSPYIHDRIPISQGYLEILQRQIETFVDELPLVDLRSVFCQQDEAPLHKVGIKNFLMANFGHNSPAMFPDLTHIYFYLWGRLNYLIFKWPNNTKQELEVAVIETFATFTPLEIINSVKSVQRKSRLCIDE